jgi:hypothetical protein
VTPPGEIQSVLGWVATILLGGGGVGGLLVVLARVHARWLTHIETKRAQTDNISIDVVRELREERAADRLEMTRLRADMDAERANCDSQLAEIRHRLSNELTHSDALELAIRAAPEKALDTLETAKRMRADRAAAAMLRGQLGNDMQVVMSAANLARRETDTIAA